MRTCGENLCTRWKTDLSKMQKRKMTVALVEEPVRIRF